MKQFVLCVFMGAAGGLFGMYISDAQNNKNTSLLIRVEKVDHMFLLDGNNVYRIHGYRAKDERPVIVEVNSGIYKIESISGMELRLKPTWFDSGRYKLAD